MLSFYACFLVLFWLCIDNYSSFIKGICLACGDDKVCAQHPLFEGGLCKECKVSILKKE